MNDIELLSQTKECIKESRKQADPERDKLFLAVLGKLDEGINKKLRKLKYKEGRTCGKLKKK